MSSKDEMLKLLLQREGSIIPFATCVALPCAGLSALAKSFEVNEVSIFPVLFDSFQIKGPPYGSFSTLLGILVVFRTSQAYTRYFNGGGLLNQMMGFWFEAVSSLAAFCRMSKAKLEDIERFQHVIARLFSLLSALALMELEGSDEDDEESFLQKLDQLEVIDGQSLDRGTLAAIRKSDHKMELVFNWIQAVVVDAVDRGILNVPPPVLSRTLLELDGGMVRFHDCMKISMLPFPFPYSQAVLVLLSLHWIITPFMICTQTHFPGMAAFWSFIIVFIFWGLNAIATELENPFGDDPNDLDGAALQRDMNAKLLLVVAGDARKLRPGLVASLSEAELDANAKRVTTLGSLWSSPKRTSRSFINIASGAGGARQSERGVRPAATLQPEERCGRSSRLSTRSSRSSRRLLRQE